VDAGVATASVVVVVLNDVVDTVVVVVLNDVVDTVVVPNEVVDVDVLVALTTNKI